MSGSDLLVSPTLAQLYIAQNHKGRARDTVDELLRADPMSGEALVLRQRLDASSSASLELHIDREVMLKWFIPGRIYNALESPPSLILCAHDAHGDGAPYYLSGPADAARGELHLPFAFSSGSATACIAHLAGPHRELRVLAVALSASW